MAKAMYIGVSNKARKVRKMYIGVSGKARKVKKAWIGVGGKARLFFSSGELSYYKTATNLSVGRKSLSGGTVGNYALFAGGYTTNSYNNVTYWNTVDAYNKSLTRSTPTALSSTRAKPAVGNTGSYIIFASTNTNGVSRAVDAYNTSLTHSAATAIADSKYQVIGASIGNYALIAGGRQGKAASHVQATVDAYNTSLTRSTPTALSTARSWYWQTGVSVGSYALFCGGNTGGYPSSASYQSKVDAYNTSLTRSTPTAISFEYNYMATAEVGNYALVIGGNGSTNASVVNAYNTSLTRSIPTAPSVNDSWYAGVGLGDYALFGGGYVYNTGAIVNAYDTSLTRSVPTGLSVSRGELAAAAIGDYALFAGGEGHYTTEERQDEDYFISSRSNSAVVDVYQLK